MRILITNDDSVSAGQLIPLIRWCRKFGEVVVAVPKYEQSGKSHGIELHTHIEAVEKDIAPDIKVWTVDSTPADCIRFAILGLNLKVDLVISGVNRGFNIGTDTMYSGTVGAACEATALGIKSLAFSTCPEYYEKALQHLDDIMEFVLDNKLLDINPIYNINIPENPKGIRITRQGGSYYSDDFVHIGDGLYRPTGKCVYEDTNDDTLDSDSVMRGYITIMPLTIDRTNYEAYNKLKSLLK